MGYTFRLRRSRHSDRREEWTGFDRQINSRPFQALPGRAHPLAQERSMGGCLVMGMVKVMRGHLEGQSPTHQEQTDGQSDGDNSFKGH